MKLLVSTIAVASIAAGLSLTPAGTVDRIGQVIVPTSEMAPAQYVSVAIGRRHIARTINATGSLQAVSTVEVSSQLSGQIAELAVDFNEAVKGGQPLARLDQRGYRARVAQAEAEQKMAQETVAVLSARLEKAEGTERETIAGRKIHAARIDKAQVELERANRALARTEKLASRGAKSRSEVEDAQSAALKAQAELREIRASAAAQEQAIATAAAGRREVAAELASARAALPLRRAALQLAELDLDRSTIRSPIDGVVINRNVEKGQTVATSLDAPTLFTIAGDLGQMEIHAGVDEADIGHIKVGQRAEFTVDAFPGRRFEAVVTELRKGAKRSQGVVSYTVVLSAGNREGLLLPGMTTKIAVTIEAIDDVLTVPLAALRFSPSDDAVNASTALEPGEGVERTVWLLDSDSRPRAVKVKVGIDDGRDAVLLGGSLSAGQRVVTGNLARPVGNSLFGIRF